MKLSPHEIGSPLWTRLSTHYENRIAKLRSRIESDCDSAETARLRAQISEIKAFLAMALPGREKEANAE